MRVFRDWEGPGLGSSKGSSGNQLQIMGIVENSWGGMGWWIEMGPKGSNDGVGGIETEALVAGIPVLGWNWEASSGGVIPLFLRPPFSMSGDHNVLQSSACSSWVPDVRGAEEKSVGCRACPGLGDSLWGEVSQCSQYHCPMKTHPSYLGHCLPSCH